MWSRIQDTELANQVRGLIQLNEQRGCSYHNYAHVCSMYSFLETKAVAYDEALDWAILFHDSVYDAGPEKELRSSNLFTDLSNRFEGCTLDAWEKRRVNSLILDTITHRIGVIKGSMWIVKADLHALTNTQQTVTNFAAIMNESIALYSCTPKHFAETHIYFLSAMHTRMSENLCVDSAFFESVQQGITTSINLAKVLLK